MGKSTLLNVLLDYKLAIMSPKPQTTRHQLLGLLSGPGYQIAFLDTPGLIQRARDLLDRRMRSRVMSAMQEADLAVLVVEAKPPGAIETRIMEALRESGRRTILAINKIDRVAKPRLLPVIVEYSRRFPFLEAVPVSALGKDGTALLLDRIVAHLPEGEAVHEADAVTDRPERFLVEELVREQLFLLYGQEVPYDTAVEVEEFRESSPEEGRKDLIRAVVYVNKHSQRHILVGRAGAALKEVGTRSRGQIEEMLGRPVYLELWVRVRPGWRQDEGFLRELGYEPPPPSGEGWGTEPNAPVPLSFPGCERVHAPGCTTWTWIGGATRHVHGWPPKDERRKPSPQPLRIANARLPRRRKTRRCRRSSNVLYANSFKSLLFYCRL